MILQIRVRNALKNENEPLMLAGRKKSFKPTANKVLELFAYERQSKNIYCKAKGAESEIKCNRKGSRSFGSLSRRPGEKT